MNNDELQEEIERKEKVIQTLKHSLEHSVEMRRTETEPLKKEISGLKTKVKELEADLNDVCCAAESIMSENMQDINLAAYEEQKSLIKALQFYANPINYQPIKESKFAGAIPVILDNGYRARRRLDKNSGFRSFAIMKHIIEKLRSHKDTTP